MASETPNAPAIYKPHSTTLVTVLVYSTNAVEQIITGTADSLTESMLVNGSSTGLEFNPVGATEDLNGLSPGQWRLTTSTVNGANIFAIQGVGYDGSTSSAASLTIYLVLDTSLGFIAEAPTSVRMDRYANRVQFELSYELDVSLKTDFIVGFNFYASLEPGGGLGGYTLLNTSLNTEYTDIEDLEQTTTTETDRIVDSEDSNQFTQTDIVTTVFKRQYNYTFDHVRSNNESSSVYPQRTEAFDIFKDIEATQEIYYVATAVAYDPAKFIEQESTYSGELVGLPLVISTQIKDLTPRTLDESQADIIKEILRVQSNIDVRPGEVTRDIHVDPPAWEANRVWFILDFVSRSQSFLTLLQIDDPQQTGTSLTFSESPYKQALAQAMGLTETETQVLVDDSFVKLASNSLTERSGNTKATGFVTFRRRTLPTQDLIVYVGDSVSSSGDTVAGISEQTYVTTTSKTLKIESGS